MKAAEGEIRIFDEQVGVAEAAADILLQTALEKTGATVALSGGSTPKTMYADLRDRGESAAQILRNVHYFFGDERAVPNDHPSSNVGMAECEFLQRIAIDPAQVHKLDGGAEDLAAEAKRASNELRRLLPATESGIPRFDLVFLGMGEDGHTASLFPGTSALSEQFPGYVVNEVPQLSTRRLTLTYPVLNAANLVVILCAGSSKASVLKKIFEEEQGDTLPVASISAHRIIWLLDKLAAKDIDKTEKENT